MTCHVQAHPRMPVALPAEDLIKPVAWDPERGVFIIAAEPANDIAPTRPSLTRLPPARPIGPFNVAPDDADALMRSLFGWCAAFLAGAAILGWR